MQSLGSRPIAKRDIATDAKISAFERHASVKLPSDYRTFLERHGGSWVHALAPIAEPTPIGAEATIESFYGFVTGKHSSSDLQSQCDLADGAPVAIPIASGAFGCQTFIIGVDNPTVGVTRGQIYYWDCNGRSSWPDEQFDEWFPNLAPSIQEYLQRRKAGDLPVKHDALSDYYLVAESFTKFFELLIPWNLDEAD